MLIRTQDKNGLINLNNIDLITTGGGQNIFAYFAGTQPQILGMYSTQEKAVKVLDMIQDFYNKCFAFSMGNDGYYHDVSESKVFQMPKDEEVRNGS